MAPAHHPMPNADANPNALASSVLFLCSVQQCCARTYTAPASPGGFGRADRNSLPESGGPVRL